MKICWMPQLIFYISLMWSVHFSAVPTPNPPPPPPPPKKKKKKTQGLVCLRFLKTVFCCKKNKEKGKNTENTFGSLLFIYLFNLKNTENTENKIIFKEQKNDVIRVFKNRNQTDPKLQSLNL